MTTNILVDLSVQAQAVWDAKTIDEKKQKMYDMIDSFKVKGKGGANIERFKNAVKSAKTAVAVDRIAAQIALYPDNAVVKM